MTNLITKLRKDSGFSQEDLADKLNISRPTLVSIEKGDRDLTLSELKTLGVVFDLPIEFLISEMEHPKGIIPPARETNWSKFLNLVLACIKYGAEKDGKITKTKLAKLVYLCDFGHYYKTLKPISGFEYKKLANGPVPIEFFEIVDTNESLTTENKGGAILVSLIEQPNEEAFSEAELDLIKTICKKWKSANTQEIVNFTHKQIPWAVCKDRETIPYELINMEEPENIF
jgi:transcriptional regulator with XRE-family HTH domain